MNKILLVDGNSILNRAFYGLPDLTTRDGRHTNAILGFLNIVLKVVDDIEATHICVAFDLKDKTFRHEMYAEYKGTRKGMPDELREQLPVMKEVLHSMNIKTIELAGFEADDLLGTLSRTAYKEGFKVVLLSGDRDLLQLATDDIQVKIPKTKAGKTIMEDYYANDVKELYGVEPITFIDMKGLMGDTSDNIPGVPGIGEKTASKLLVTYGSLEGIYDHMDEIKKSKMKDNLIEYKEQAFFSRVLATIKLDVPIAIDTKDLMINDLYNEASMAMFADLELKSLMSRFDKSIKQQNFILDYILISEYDDAIDIFNKSKKADKVGISLIQDEGIIYGCSLCFDNKTYLINAVNFITDDLIRDKYLDIISSLNRKYILDIKNELYLAEFEENDNVIDCGLAAYLLDPIADGYDYDVLAKCYANISIEDKKTLVGKKKINEEWSEDAELCKYFSYLSYVPYCIGDALLDKLSENDMEKLYYDIELPCIYSLFEMEKNGVLVDKEGLVRYGEKLNFRIDDLTKEIYEKAGVEFNINSTKQLGDILFERLQLKSGKKTKTGYSTGVEVLEKLKNEHPIIPLILEYRQLTKLYSTYVEGLKGYIRSDGRIHGKFNQTVTATGRISSTDPNLQNIPTRFPLGREIRKVFVPKEGYVLLDADYSQIELRVLAHMSGDKTLIDAYNKDADIHAVTASEVFEVPLEKVTGDLRRKAKAVNFGIVYGISSFGLGQDLDISRKEAEGYISKYFETYTDLKTFLEKCVSDAKEKGYTLTMFNRRRPIPELTSSNFMTRSFGERAAMNSPIQGSAADIIKLAMIKVNRRLKEEKLESKLILQVHDELMIETKIEELDKVKKILIESMTSATELDVPLIVDMKVGNSWYETK